METPTKKTIDALNLASVQRIDACAEEIIDRCTYASLYSYAKSEGWQKTDIEGPLLVYRRADAPIHSFIIANRHSRQDFIEPISPALQLCLKSSYIMLKKPEEKEIFGIWICDTTDCERIYKLLQKLVAECSKSSQNKTASGSPNLLDILSRPPEAQDPDKLQSAMKPKGNGEMPAMLQKLLCDERQLPRGNVPKGAVSADQIEKQLLCDQAARQKLTESSKKNNTESSMTSNFSCASFGALSTTATRGSECALTLAPEDDFSSTSAAGCSSTTGISKHVEVSEKDVTVSGKEVRSQQETNTQPVVGLSKAQLVQTFEHLLRTDDDFVAKLHLAYIDSLNLRLGI